MFCCRFYPSTMRPDAVNFQAINRFVVVYYSIIQHQFAATVEAKRLHFFLSRGFLIIEAEMDL